MAIPLSEFELHVRPEPLERGLSLFETGQVELLRNAGKGRMEAVVHDAGATFHPVLIVEQEAVTKASCDCGQASDGICRHQVAVMFTMAMGDFKEGVVTRSGKMPVEKVPSKRIPAKDAKANAPAKAKPSKPPKPPKTVADLLELLPKEEIVKFLVDLCKSDRQLTLRVKSQFSDLLPLENPADLIKRIEESFKAVGKVKARILKNQVEDVGKAGHHWMDEIIRYARLGQLDMTTTGLKVLFAQMATYLNERDFPAEKRAALLAKLKEVIDAMVEAGKGKPEMGMVVDTCISMSRSFILDNEPYLLKAACAHCTTAEDLEKLEKELLQHESQPGSQVYGIHYKMIERLKGPEAARAFRKKHENNVFFTAVAIRECIMAKDYDKAMNLISDKLSKEGQRLYKYEVPLLYWYNLREEVFTAKSDLQGRLMNILDIQLLDHYGPKPSIKTLADKCSPSDWAALRTKVLPLLHKSPYRSHPLLVIELFRAKDDRKAFSEYIDGMTLKALMDFANEVSYRMGAEHAYFSKAIGEKLVAGLLHHAQNRLEIDKATARTIYASLRQVFGPQEVISMLKNWRAKYPNYLPFAEMQINRW